MSQAKALIVAVAVLLLFGLSACRKWPTPTPVPFPDDPRVLHGAWELVVTQTHDWFGAEFYFLDDRAEHLVIWPDASRPRAYQHDGAGGFVEMDIADPGRLEPPFFDVSLNSVVSLHGPYSDATVVVVPLAGGPATTSPLFIPPDMDWLDSGAGSGRAFMLLKDSNGAHELRWWESLTGVSGGSRLLPSFDELPVFTDGGKAILLWDVADSVVHVIDTADPLQLLTVSFDGCMTSRVSEVSANGRWLVFAACNDDLMVVDLADIAAGASPLDVKRRFGLTFAADSTEIVWADSNGSVRTLDVDTRARETVLQLTAEEIERIGIDRDSWTGPGLHLNRGAELLALSKGDGLVHVVGLGSNPISASLPRQRFDSATLDLIAVPGADWPPGNQYQFSGTIDIAWTDHVDATPLIIEGEVTGGTIHIYVPTQQALQPQLSPPPAMEFVAAIRTTALEDPVYTLRMDSNYDRDSSSYHSAFYFVGRPGYYEVTLQRPASYSTE